MLIQPKDLFKTLQAKINGFHRTRTRQAAVKIGADIRGGRYGNRTRR
jgi:hypothetical protein